MHGPAALLHTFAFQGVGRAGGDEYAESGPELSVVPAWGQTAPDIQIDYGDEQQRRNDQQPPRSCRPRREPHAPTFIERTSCPTAGDAEGQEQIATQLEAFDFEAAERAEILREHEVLQTMLMAHLKNEDGITKKWIALI
ncbi:MAG: hypothetical protein ABSD52_04775 [Candidatus Cybelea sp.]